MDTYNNFEQDYKKISKALSAAQNYCEQGVDYVLKRSYDRALQHLERAADIFNGQGHQQWYNYAILYKIKALKGLAKLDTALQYCERLEKNYLLTNDKYNLVLLKLEYAQIYMMSDEPKKAFIHLQAAKLLVEKMTDHQIKANVYAELGNFWSNQKIYSAAISSYNKALSLFTDNNSFWCWTYKQLADIKAEIWLFDEALAIYQQLLTKELIIKDIQLSSQIINAIADIYKQRGDKANLHSWQQKLIELNQLSIKTS